MRKNLFIVLEGLSGVGKTKVGELLAKKLNALFYSTPSGPFLKIRGTIHSTGDIKFLYNFYLASVIYASGEIKRLLLKEPVVCTRFLLTTRCYYKALGLDQEVNYDKLDILEPDFVFLLTCNKQIQKLRLDARGRTKHDQEEEERVGLTERILQEYRKYQSIEIDTSFLSLEEVVEIILTAIQI